MMRTAGLVLAVALAVPAAVGGVVPPVAQTQTPAQTTTGTGVIAGRVVEVDSTRPVSEAIVTLSSGSIGDRRVMVDEQGRFAFVNLPVGQYELIAEQFGYLRSAYGRYRPEGAPVPIPLSDGQRVLDATISMWRAASITGRVLDDAGEPVTRVTVRALRRTASVGRVDLEPSGQISASTDDRGVYRLTRLAPGDYAVMVSARLSTFPVDILRDAMTSGVNLGVGEVARLGDSRYLQLGDQVIATMSYGVAPPAPDASGRFRVFQTTYYPAATSVEDAEVMTIGPGEDRSAIDLRLGSVPAVSVSGRIVGPDGPVSLKPFRLVRAGGSPAYETYDHETATGITTADGTFKLLGVPSGRYLLRLGPTSIQSVPAPAGSAGTSIPPLTAVSDPIVVGDSDVTGVSVTAHAIATLRGRVEATGSGAAVPPSESMELIIQAFGSGTLLVANPRVDKSNAFSTPILPGRYLLTAFAAGSRCASVSVNGKEVGDALVPIGHDDVQVVFTCGAGMARITGRVRDDNGNADLRGQAIVFPTDRRQWAVDDSRPIRFGSARPNSNGVFTAANLPAGEYFVAAVPDAIGNAWQDPKLLETLARSATRITVGAGETRSIDVTTVVVK